MRGACSISPADSPLFRPGGSERSDPFSSTPRSKHAPMPSCASSVLAFLGSEGHHASRAVEACPPVEERRLCGRAGGRPREMLPLCAVAAPDACMRTAAASWEANEFSSEASPCAREAACSAALQTGRATNRLAVSTHSARAQLGVIRHCSVGVQRNSKERSRSYLSRDSSPGTSSRAAVSGNCPALMTASFSTGGGCWREAEGPAPSPASSASVSSYSRRTRSPA